MTVNTFYHVLRVGRLNIVLFILKNIYLNNFEFASSLIVKLHILCWTLNFFNLHVFYRHLDDFTFLNSSTHRWRSRITTFFGRCKTVFLGWLLLPKCLFAKTNVLPPYTDNIM